MTIYRLLTAAAATALVAGSAMAQTPAASPLAANGDIMNTLRTSGQFTTFVKAVDATNLASLLQKQPNITVFAPTDAAFAAAYPGGLDQLISTDAGKQELQKVLIYHLINAKVDSSKIKGARGPVPAGSGDKIVLDGSQEGVLKAENATIIQADVAASNGLIDVVDQVLKPNSVPETLPEAQASEAPASTTETAAAAESDPPSAKAPVHRKK